MDRTLRERILAEASKLGVPPEEIGVFRDLGPTITVLRPLPWDTYAYRSPMYVVNIRTAEQLGVIAQGVYDDQWKWWPGE